MSQVHPDPHRPDVDEATRRILQIHGFDEPLFQQLCGRLMAKGAEAAANNAITGRIQPPGRGDIDSLPELGTEARRQLADRGRDAIRASKVGAVILAGGMATRFGGVVKASVPVVDGRSFLEVKIADVRRAARDAGSAIPVYLMTSFATDAEVARLARTLTSAEAPIITFTQSVSLRLLPDGSLFRDRDGKAQLYAPGHGDLPSSLRRSGILDRFRSAGGHYLCMSNVDNVAATLDSAIVGAHIEAGKAVTCEVVDKEEGDKGGAPARVDDVLQIVESFRFPANFAEDQIPVFNTNTFVFDAAALDREFVFDWFLVKKTVDGIDVVQFERLVGQLTGLLPTSFLRVARHGADARFQPVKDPEELRLRADEIRAILAARGVL